MVDAEDKIKLMNSLIREKALIEKELERVFCPVSDDLDVVGNLYDVFVRALEEVNPAADPTSKKSRKKFLFVAMFMFSPSALAGSKLRFGLRDKLAEIIGTVKPTSLSHSIEGITFLYMNYKSFKKDVDHILLRSIEWLERYTKKV